MQGCTECSTWIYKRTTVKYLSFDNKPVAAWKVYLADHCHYSNTSQFPLSSALITSPPPVLALSPWLLGKIFLSLRYFLKGSSTVRYPFHVLLNCTLAKEAQLFPGLGIYSGIFVMYLNYSSESNKSRTATILFYALCLLYVLSTATVVSDLTNDILTVSNNAVYL